MSMATLHMLCGKIASGKSTLANRLGAEPSTVILSQDHLLSSLFPEEIRSVQDFGRCSARLWTAIEPHIVDLLTIGINVVLDFEANTLASRQRLRSAFEKAGSAHVLHVLNVADEVCLERLAERNATGRHPYYVTPDEFRAFAQHFVPPAEDEGLKTCNVFSTRVEN